MEARDTNTESCDECFYGLYTTKKGMMRQLEMLLIALQPGYGELHKGQRAPALEGWISGKKECLDKWTCCI